MKIFLKVAIVALFFGLLIFFVRNGNVENAGAYVIFGDTKVKVEIVNTDATRELGLSGRPSLALDTGMLFIFETVGQYGFWMKDMHFAIDIIWMDEDKNIVYIKKDATPETFPESFGGEVSSLYVLEVPAGFADLHNLHLGDRTQFDF